MPFCQTIGAWREPTPEECARNEEIDSAFRIGGEIRKAEEKKRLAILREWRDRTPEEIAADEAASLAAGDAEHAEWLANGAPDDFPGLLIEWQAKRKAVRAAAELEWDTIHADLRVWRYAPDSTDREIEAAEEFYDYEMADWHAKYDHLWPKRELDEAARRFADDQKSYAARIKAAEENKVQHVVLGPAGMPMLGNQATATDLGQPIVDGFLASQGGQPSRNAPMLPDAMRGHPLYEKLNLTIAHIFGAAERPATFRAAAVVDTLAVLALVHEQSCKTVVDHIRARGCALPEGKLAAAVTSFENRVIREVRGGAGWRTNNKGEPDPQNSDNIGVFLSLVGVQTRYNVWRQRVELRKQNGQWVPLTDAELNNLRSIASQEEYRFKPTKEFFRDMLSDHARKTSYDPVLNRIDAAEAAWDRQPRLAVWLTRACGVPCDRYHQSVGKNIIGGIVRRARHPGCKHDNMPIFIGSQGCRKSTLARILALDDDWFTDSVDFDGTPQNVIPQLFGKLVVELAELDGMARREAQHVKRFLSVQNDNVTLKYEALASDRARRCVFLGTTNDESPLVDTTGNRRFLPIRVEHEIDTDWLRENIDQLVGEAATLESAGKSFDIPREVWADAAVRQEESRNESPIEVLLQSWFANVPDNAFVTTADLLHALTLAKQNASAKGLAPLMRRVGFRRIQGRTADTGKVRAWLKSANDYLPGCDRLMPTQTLSGKVEMRMRPAS